MVNDGVTRSAVLSPCGDYRYSLVREWGNGPRLGVVMLNPSTADEAIDDPTMRKVQGFGQRLGYGSVEVCNLFALRATNPATLWGVRRNVEHEPGTNDAALAGMVGRSVRVLEAWGTHRDKHRQVEGRIVAVRRLLAKERVVTFRLRSTKHGHPEHPLYIPFSVLAQLGADARPPQDGEAHA